jgi:hypothetical protein
MGPLTKATSGATGRRAAMPLALAAGLCLVAILLGGCAEARPAWGPGTPRNGAGQPVDPTFGTPLPGYTTINNG